jgi:hypothetical protein
MGHFILHWWTMAQPDALAGLHTGFFFWRGEISRMTYFVRVCICDAAMRILVNNYFLEVTSVMIVVLYGYNNIHAILRTCTYTCTFTCMYMYMYMYISHTAFMCHIAVDLWCDWWRCSHRCRSMCRQHHHLLLLLLQEENGDITEHSSRYSTDHG